MTKREAAIIGAYTGILIGDFDDLMKYAEEKLETKGITTIGMAMIADKLKKASKEDFLGLEIK